MGSRLGDLGVPFCGLGVLGTPGSHPYRLGGPQPTVWGFWGPWVLSLWFGGPPSSLPHGVGVPIPQFGGSGSPGFCPRGFGVPIPPFGGSVPMVWGPPVSPLHGFGAPHPTVSGFWGPGVPSPQCGGPLSPLPTIWGSPSHTSELPGPPFPPPPHSSPYPTAPSPQTTSSARCPPQVGPAEGGGRLGGVQHSLPMGQTPPPPKLTSPSPIGSPGAGAAPRGAAFGPAADPHPRRDGGRGEPPIPRRYAARHGETPKPPHPTAPPPPTPLTPLPPPPLHPL